MSSNDLTFEQTKEMMKRFGKGKKGMRLPF